VARAGKHILCEKPLALTPDEVLSMAAAVKTGRITFVMGFMRRFDSSFQRARQMISEGAIGQPIVIKSTGRGPGLPPSWAWDINLSNGMLGEVNSHDFDAVRWLLGSEYQNVYARGRNFKSYDVAKSYPNFYDNAVVLIEMESGAIGTVDGSCPADYGYDARIEVLGTEGVLFVGTTAENSVTVWTKPKGVRQSGVTSWKSLFREAYLAEDRHLVDCIWDNTPPLVGLEDGLRALEVVRAANYSIQSAQAEEVRRAELPK
jgi:myo-inositol 2-dehydrogenase/D-chiro-inositol 1-dehydrogenase/scyllo-inositol 2-dehydrogenase (NAD+)